MILVLDYCGGVGGCYQCTDALGGIVSRNVGRRNCQAVQKTAQHAVLPRKKLLRKKEKKHEEYSAGYECGVDGGQKSIESTEA
ncbi:MAG: hypothetical protein PF692_08695 [Kiritimatiellae bacterium]|nr:hypothetical protein [Kiritimatiellia bacterium]